MVPQNCSVSQILQNIFLCVQQNKDSQIGNYSELYVQYVFLQWD